MAPTASPAGDQQREHDERSRGMNQGMQVLSYLISGILCYGALGWLGDHLLGTGFLLPLGIVAGAALGIYVIIRRFGQVDATAATTTTTDTTEGTT